jgi:high-affinity iron transporter
MVFFWQYHCVVVANTMQCCSPLENGDDGWGIFNSLFGWQNSATYGSVISYNLYWLVVIAGFLVLGFKEKKGRWPFMKAKATTTEPDTESETGAGVVTGQKEDGGGVGRTAVREITE